MPNMDILRARLDEIETSELRAIDTEAGDAALTPEQNSRWTALDNEAAEIRKNIAALEAEEKRAAERAEARKRWGSVTVAGTSRTDPFDLGEMRGLQGDALIDRARSAFDPAFTRKGASAEAQEILRKIEAFSEREDKDAELLARYALVNGSDAYRSAFKDWMRAAAKGNAPVFNQAQAEAVRASMSLTSANGGYALPTLLDPTLIQTGAMTKNPIRRIARVEQGMVDKWNGVTAGNVTTYWKAEGSAFTDGSPTLGAASVDAAMLTAYVTGSYEIFQDSNLLAQLPGLIGTAIDMAEGVAFVSGSGSAAPKGIITAISATVASTVTATTRGTFNSTSAVDTLAMFNALPSRYEDSSTWLMNKATYLNIAQQTFGTAGGKIVDMTAKDVILDSPVVRASSVTAATTSGSIPVVLGDFSEFIVYDRLGVNVEFIQNVVDGSGLPTGQRGLVAYKRVGSDVADLNAFRFLLA